MGDLYRVIVVRETDANADDGVTETIVELAAPREMLAQFAPQAVAAALGTTAQDAALVTRVDPPRMATEGPAETTEQKTERRKRRTKAEMEMARALENGGSVTRGNDGQITIDDPGPREDEPLSVVTTFESAKPVPAEPEKQYNPFG